MLRDVVLVSIRQEAQSGSVALEHVELLGRPVRTKRSHRTVDADGLQTKDIRRTFHQIEATFLGGSRPCLLDAEDGIAFLIEYVVRRVEILGCVLVVRHRTRGVSNNTIVLVPDGNHNATAEEVEFLMRFVRVFEQSHRLE